MSGESGVGNCRADTLVECIVVCCGLSAESGGRPEQTDSTFGLSLHRGQSGESKQQNTESARVDGSELVIAAQ